ncbi:hypothetical protein CCL16_22155, partial [Pseudomonas syringae]
NTGLRRRAKTVQLSGGSPLQRGNAFRDAPRHRSTPRHLLKVGRRASRTACPRGASAQWCSCGHLQADQSISLMTCSEGSRDLPDFSSSCR